MRLFISALALTSLWSCRNVSDTNSSGKIAPADRTAKNVAFIVGSPNDLRGVAKDVEQVTKLIREGDFGYEIVVINNATVDQIMTKAAEIGKALSEKSTVFFYFSGHGSESGFLMAQNTQPFLLSDVIQKIGSGLTIGKFKRFIGIMDSCFSGQSVNGSQAILSLSGGKQTTFTRDQVVTSTDNIVSEIKKSVTPFDQGLILAAAQRDQTSLDAGQSVGGVFTSEWVGVVKKNMGKNSGTSTATLRDVLTETEKVTEQQAGSDHVPVWKALPDSILDEPLTGVAGSSSSSQNEIYVELTNDASGSGFIISTPTSIAGASIILCKGTSAVCSVVNAPAEMSFISTTELVIANRLIFKGDKALTLVGGDIFTIVATKNGAAVLTRTIKITAK